MGARARRRAKREAVDYPLFRGGGVAVQVVGFLIGAAAAAIAAWLTASLLIDLIARLAR